MSQYRSDPESLDFEKPSACANLLHYIWKTITCIFSHITLVSMVVSYCYLGAITFQFLEGDHEKEVKQSIVHIRDNTTYHLWNFTQEMDALKEEKFLPAAEMYLKEFENSLLKAMAKEGWNGDEDLENKQWSIPSALFYSIVVITTIGYGHITPKTNWGKVVTIFYAILGIPLMLLCLSNIGDIMATSFRFLYWRVCCYVCERKPKKRQIMARGRSFRSSTRTESKFSRSRSAGSFRRSVRNSGKSADSGYQVSDLPSYHSDTELRYPDKFDRVTSLQSRRSNGINRANRYSESSVPPKKTLTHTENMQNNFQRGGSLDRKKIGNQKLEKELELDPILLAKTPILCNKYVVGKNDAFANNIPARRAASMPKTSNFLAPPRSYTPESSSDKEDIDEPLRSRSRIKPRRSRSRSPLPRSSPKMMTPLGYGQRNKYLDEPDSEEYDDYSSYYESTSQEKPKPVPIWLCVLLVISYILGGAYLFKSWEGWNYLDAAYFCFVTLTTIGFGDFFPAKGVSDAKESRFFISLTLCSLYLLFGISLLAMSFNLVQEEVISNVKSVAKTLGIIKSESDQSEEEDY